MAACRAVRLIEEGLAYRVDVLELSASKFRIKINNPGEPTDIAFVPADTVP